MNSIALSCDLYCCKSAEEQLPFQKVQYIMSKPIISIWLTLLNP